MKDSYIVDKYFKLIGKSMAIEQEYNDNITIIHCLYMEKERKEKDLINIENNIVKYKEIINNSNEDTNIIDDFIKDKLEFNEFDLVQTNENIEDISGIINNYENKQIILENKIKDLTAKIKTYEKIVNDNLKNE